MVSSDVYSNSQAASQKKADQAGDNEGHLPAVAQRENGTIRGAAIAPTSPPHA